MHEEQSMYIIHFFQIASAAAFRHQKTNPNLGSRQMSDSQVKSVFTNAVNRGDSALMYTSKTWLEDVKKMYHLFNGHHPKVQYLTIAIVEVEILVL